MNEKERKRLRELAQSRAGIEGIGGGEITALLDALKASEAKVRRLREAAEPIARRIGADDKLPDECLLTVRAGALKQLRAALADTKEEPHA